MHTYIDSALLLRVLLEFYRMEKVSKHNILKEALLNITTFQKGQQTVKFNDFRMVKCFSFLFF